MTTELFFLTLTAILAASLWIPYIVGVNSTGAPMPADNRPANQADMAPWVHRAFRAHLNLLEQFLPFAVIVIVAHLAGVSNAVTIWASGLFFVLRLAHAVWMIGGFPVLPVRPIIFTAGWVCVLAIAVAVLVA
ncbi:MAPEG family protein [Thalassococcus sp. CAU 1522]|uniref:MAPEG family protein n=1 Tax=Thalassococcus arenae TaxID=2851652 RepID=A0ABS6N414_9RHOB|nr:MAPEG family protein [Thalassococcus arenae]MBV2358329.1 MAPEG family protein [Thalassococcus arenae]